MKKIVYLVTAAVLTAVVSGCGQSGALVLPSDPNMDKRSQYLLYRSEKAQPTARTSSSATAPSTQP